MSTINTGDTAFMLVSTALVFFMTPGLALFYGGMVRRKNVLNTIMASFSICGIASVMWVLFGYSLSFSEDFTGLGILGGLKYFALGGLGVTSDYASTIPSILFVSFQMMFAIITPALITGASAERIKFSGTVLFTILWSILVYYPLAHMVWGADGYLNKMGALDFAGGNVVHISSAVSGLVLCIMLGKRKGHGMTNYHPHNLPLVFIGAAVLWFGWFGFNAGSALSSGSLAVHAFMATNTSAASALLSWMVIEKITRGKPTMLGAVTGAVVGLVAITPAAGFVPIWSSIIIGAVVSPLCYFALNFIKVKFGYDDALDAFGCHGIGGIWGGIATGLFANKEVNSFARWNGLVYGDSQLILRQIASIAITICLALVGTFIVVVIIKALGKLRVSPKDEINGLDYSEHGESAYPAFAGFDQ